MKTKGIRKTSVGDVCVWGCWDVAATVNQWGAWTVEEQREAWTSGEQRRDKNAEENKRDWTASLRPPRRRPETGLLYCLAPPERRWTERTPHLALPEKKEEVRFVELKKRWGGEILRRERKDEEGGWRSQIWERKIKKDK